VTAAALRHPKHEAKRHARDREWPALVARVGIVARAAIHLIVGWLAIRLARGDLGEQADQRGALNALARQPLGKWLLVAMGIGFLAYAGWRALEAVIDTEDKGVLQRIGQALRAVLYVGLAVTAFRMAFANTGGGTGGSRSQQLTTGVMGMTGGRWVVAAAGLAVVGTGLWNGWRAVSRSFTKRIKEAEMSATERTWTIRAGVAGHAARMVAYLIVGWFLLRAAWRFDPQQPIGLDASLHAVAQQSYGPILLFLVGAGVIVFGLYQLMLARYREVLDS
jgi:hypothetical protein